MTNLQGFRLSPDQARIWSLERDLCAFRTQVAFQLEGQVDYTALKDAWQRVVDRHEILRTTFRQPSGITLPLQMIADTGEPSWQQVDLSSHPADQRQAEVDRFLQAELKRPFDLERGDLLRLSLLTFSPGEHLLVVEAPSLCVDTRSICSLVDEAFELYANGESADSGDEQLQYADFADWNHQLLEEDANDPGLVFWRDQNLGRLSMPTLAWRAQTRTDTAFEPGRISTRSGAGVVAKAERLAREAGVGVADVYSACLTALIMRLANETDFLVGAAPEGRGHESLDNAVGLFSKTLPIRAHCDDATRFRELVVAIGRSRKTAAEWQHYFSWKGAIQPADAKATAAYLPVAFEYRPGVDTRRSGGISYRPRDQYACTDRFDVKLVCFTDEGSLVTEFYFDNKRLPGSDVERVSRHYHALLEAAVAEPETLVRELEILDEVERRRILLTFNDTQKQREQDQCVHELFEAQVQRTPDAAAVVFEDRTVTYGELNGYANQLAHRLRSRGIGPDAVVGLCVERSLDVIVAMLGILKAGGAYLPLDPDLPSQRIATLVSSARVQVIVTQPRLVEHLRATTADVLVLDAEPRVEAGESRENCVSGVSAANLAYVMFTSGSTGTPKGVLIEHRQLTNYVDGVLDRLEVPPGTSFATVSSFAADLGNTAIFPALLRGGCLHVVSQQRVLDPDALAAYSERGAIDCLKIVPSHLNALLSTARPERVLPNVRLILGGEASSWDFVERLEACAAGCAIVNHYGPTEATVGVLAYRHQRGQRRDDESKTLPLGRPLNNSQVYLLDPRLNPVPIGVSGELHISGAGLARGYLDHPAQTAERFIPSPHSVDAGARMYRTGDLARYLRDGSIEFQGRADHQVKIRGFRVELGEIESVLARHESVEDAVVLAHEDGAGDKRLVAFAVARKGVRLTIEALSSYARERLPHYMVPATIVLLDKLPLNRNGKVDRAALSALSSVSMSRERTLVSPRTPTEEKLLAIWTEVLGKEQLGVEDDFFDMGGHSLLAMQLITRVRAEFHVELPLPTFFDAPTVAGLAKSIESLPRADESAEVSLRAVPRADNLPLSFAQQRLWFLEKLEPEAVAYNRTFAIRLGGPLNRTALEQTLGEILRRHEVLRTIYPEVDGKAIQVIAPPTELSLPLVGLPGLAPAQQEAEIHRLIQTNALRRFDLSKGPLVRACLLQLSDVDHVLISSHHHINTDAWSNGVYLREVSSLYAAFASGNPSPLDALPIQYADYAVWQREWLEGESLQAQLSYWKQELQNVPSSLDLPTDRPRPAMQTFHGARREFSLSPSQSQLLKELSAREGTTLFMTLLAAFQALLYRYTGQADILVGSPIAGRTRREVEGLIGFFVNTLVLRADLRGNPTFLDLLAQVRERALQAYAHQDLPFEKLIDELQIARDLSRTPLFQVMFLLQTDAMASLNLPELTLQPVETEIQATKFDLTLNVLETDQGMNGSLEYNTDLFEAASIDRMLSHFKVLVESITNNPQQRVSDLPLLTAPEQNQVLVEWNATHTQYPQHDCLHELFEQQAQKSPDALAVIFEREQLTYRELNDRANALARHLRERGVGPEVVVGVFMERSIDLMVGLLGILKAGGAYLPLDPEHPKDRLTYYLQDARPALLISQHRLLERLPHSDVATLCLDADWAVVVAARGDRAPARVVPDNAAYVIYTSGSTGQPKGAINSHRGICNRLHWMQQTYGLDGTDRVMQKTPATFDVSVWEFFWPIMTGASLVFARPDGHRDPAYLMQLIAEERITTLHFVPSMLQVFLDSVSETTVVSVPRLRRVVCSGEALPHSLKERFLSRFKGVELHNLYGPTEAAVDVTAIACEQHDGRHSVPIGRPVANTQIYLLDREQRPVPVGVAGELHIGGVQLARAYHHRPGLTAEKFIPNPIGDRPGSRLYRTGDLTRWLADGNVDFLGRIDHQVKVHGQRIELGEIEAVMSQHPSVREVVVVAQEERPGAMRLVAYWTCKGHPVPTIAELRSDLLKKLPSYMVPAVFVMLEKLPLNSNGKLDRRALPKPDQTRPGLEQELVFARTPLEERLSRIWTKVLGLERVGVHDNFFELGGDSILSIQIVSQANQAGLRLTPKDIFQHQTIAELAATAGTAQVIEAEQGLVTGSVPLTAIQHWFFDREFADPHHFNQAVLLQTPTALAPEWMEAALKALLEHHDVLRHNFRREGSAWHQSGGDVSQTSSFSTFDLSALPETERALETERLARQLQQSLNLSHGPLVRAAQFKLGTDGPARLLLVIHHLVVDGVSWRILLEDLQTAYDQLSRGEAIRLPAKTTSFAHFSKRCAEFANSPGCQKELDYWSKPASQISRLPVDHPQGDNTVESSRSITVSLSPEETGVLLREVPAVYQTQMNDVLLTALGGAFGTWTGSSSLVVDLEGHGREELFADVDLSRTVGWFTTLFPVRLEVSATADQSTALKSVKEQLRAVPNRGMGYGLLRYLSRSSEQIERLRSQPRAEVMFNYLGQVDRVLPAESKFQWARESSGPAQSHRAKRSHLMDVRGMISDGSLQVSFQYSDNVFHRKTIEQLAGGFLAALRSLISHCQSPEAGGYTPSDFALASLTQPEIDRHFGNDRTVEDVYGLSPLQEGMLFHCLHAPNSGAYVTHLVLRLDGTIDVQAFHRAWDSLIARHSVLRTGFLWDQVSEAVQVVRRDAKVEWTEEDWRGANDGAQRADLRSFLKTDRVRGFDLSKAPLIRLALIRIADDAYYFVWTHHHLVIDGWSVPLVLQEALELYKSFLSGAGSPLPTARPFRDYIAWLKQQDLVKAESYWRTTLAGLEAPTSLGVPRSTDEGIGEIGNAEYHSRLSQVSTRSLRAFAREHDLTVNTVVQGAWALLLSAYSGEEDVVYGAALSGRPPSLTDVARIPGMFINTLPVRVRIDADVSAREWLRRLQEQQVELREYEYSALTQVQGWSQVPRSLPLFDVIVAFQNFPIDRRLIEEAAKYGLGIELVLSQEQSTSPFTLFVSLEDELDVRLVYDRKKFDERTIAGIADRYLRILEGIISRGDAALMDLRIEADSKAPQLPTMAILAPSEEELLLLGSDVDMQSVTSERED